MSNNIPPENQQVTAVISHFVKETRKEGYEEWLAGISAVAREFEGYCGASIIRPTKEIGLEYVIILRFDSYLSLRTWIESDIRKEWIERAKPLIEKPEKIQVTTGLESWFSVPGKQPKSPPPRYKMALLTWFAVYCCLMLVQFVFRPIFKLLPSPIVPIISIGIVVAMLTYVVMPRLTKLCYRWLYPQAKEST